MSQLDNIRRGAQQNQDVAKIVDPNLRNTKPQQRKPQQLNNNQAAETIIDPNLANPPKRPTASKQVTMGGNGRPKPTVAQTMRQPMREGGNTVGEENGERIIVDPSQTVPNIEQPKTNIVGEAIEAMNEAVKRRGQEMAEYAEELQDTMDALGVSEVTPEVIEAMKVSAQDRPGSYAYMEKHGQSQGFQDSGKYQFYDPDKGSGIIEDESDDEDTGSMYNTKTDTEKIDIMYDDDEEVGGTASVYEDDEDQEQPEVLNIDEDVDEEGGEYPEEAIIEDEESGYTLEQHEQEEDTSEPVEEDEEPDPMDDVDDLIQTTSTISTGIYRGDDEDDEEEIATAGSADVEDDGSPVDQEENLEELRAFVLKHIYPEASHSKVLSLKDMRVNKKVTPATKIRGNALKAVDWAAYHTGIGFTQSAMSGSEIELLNSVMMDEGRSASNRMRNMLQCLYDHCDTKGDLSFNAWCKRIHANDLNHLSAAQYFACFADSNYQMLSCDNKQCNYTFFTENIKPLKMVEFKSDEIKRAFMEMRKNLKNDNTLVTDDLIPLGSKYFFQYKHRSLYDAYITPMTVDNEFIQKYAMALDIAQVTYAIYEMGPDGALTKIGWKEFPGDDIKTLRSKTKAINRILRNATSDELQDFNFYVAERNNPEEVDDVRYFTPEITCPRCGKVKEKEYIDSMHRFLFIRHRLVALKNTPEK